MNHVMPATAMHDALKSGLRASHSVVEGPVTEFYRGREAFVRATSYEGGFILDCQTQEQERVVGRWLDANRGLFPRGTRFHELTGDSYGWHVRYGGER